MVEQRGLIQLIQDQRKRHHTRTSMLNLRLLTPVVFCLQRSAAISYFLPCVIIRLSYQVLLHISYPLLRGGDRILIEATILIKINISKPHTIKCKQRRKIPTVVNPCRVGCTGHPQVFIDGGCGDNVTIHWWNLPVSVWKGDPNHQPGQKPQEEGKSFHYCIHTRSFSPMRVELSQID